MSSRVFLIPPSYRSCGTKRTIDLCRRALSLVGLELVQPEGVGPFKGGVAALGICDCEIFSLQQYLGAISSLFEGKIVLILLGQPDKAEWSLAKMIHRDRVRFVNSSSFDFEQAVFRAVA